MKLRNRQMGLIVGTSSFIGLGLIAGFVSAPPVGQLIFVSNRGGIIGGTPNGNDIYTMNSDGTNVQRLTTNTTSEYEPQWNPFGTRIAFTTNRDSTTGWDGNWEVYSMNPDGSDVQNLTNHVAKDFGASWNQDGTKIAFSSDRDYLGMGISDIWVMDANGTNPINLTNNAMDELPPYGPASEGQPAWSRDGSRIAFWSNRNGNQEIFVMNADGTGQTRLTNNAAIDYLPTWSPDGTKIAFTSFRSGNGDIYVMNANGTGVKRLTTSQQEENEPAWSPDGTKIVYYRRDSGENHEIYIMDASGKNQTRLTNNYPFLDADPTWKP